MRSSFLLSALLLVAPLGCSSTPEPAPQKEKEPKGAKRFTFKDDLASNRETGKELDGGAQASFVAPDGQVRQLSEWRGKALVLVFTRGFAGFVCPYCTTYTAQLAERYQELVGLGADVLLVYPAKADDQETKARFVKAVEEALAEDGVTGIPFPVFLDPGLKAVQSFNLSGDLSKPSTFVLDAKGVVTYAYVGASPDERPSVDRIVKELTALRAAQ